MIFGDSLTLLGQWNPLTQKQGYEVLLRAIGGMKASEFIFSPENYGGDIHVFWLGTNDFLRGNELTKAYDGILELTQQSKDMNKKVIVMGIPIPIGASNLM